MRDESIDFAIELEPDSVQFVPLTLYAGTPLEAELGEDAREAVGSPEIQREVRRAYRRFYGRPRRLLASLRSPATLLRRTGRYLSMTR
jgi:hypothetical protein